MKTSAIFLGLCSLVWIALGGLAAADSDSDVPIPASYEQITFTEKHDADPSVSQDGKWIAFASDRTGNYDLYVRELAGQGETQKTFHSKHDRHPSWSGTDLVYESNRTGSWDLFKMDTKQGQGELQWSSSPGTEAYASIGPNGKLLFNSAPKKGLNLSFVKKDMDISVAQDSPNQATVIAKGIDPRWSPDGGKVVFSSRRTKNSDIWIVSADGGATTQMTTDRAHDLNPCFSPDGKRIVFCSKRAGNYDLWMMNADGSGKTQLTTHPKDETSPFWAVDGKIYFVLAEKTGTTNIYAIKAPK